MAASLLTSRNYLNADAYAKRLLAASSVAPVASGYERSLRSCEDRFSRPVNAICSEGSR
jgi:hypothetical protein